MNSKPKIAILRIEGTNCDEEAYLAFKNAGGSPDYVHLNELKLKRKDLEDYQMLYIPGGFSAGDYVRAGAIFAARIKGLIEKDLVKFIDEGKPILGVCNGFQILLELGILPAIDTKVSKIPQAVLTTNDSNMFECRWVYLKKESKNCIFTRNYGEEIISLPIAHAEGKFLLSDNKFLDTLIEKDQIAFRYVDPSGNYTGYPWNPNGSVYNVAGICNDSGTIMGLMPHPERAFFEYQHPEWKRDNGRDFGKAVFVSAISYLSKKF